MYTDKPQQKFGPGTSKNCRRHPPSYPIENVQERFLPVFYYGKGGGWRRQFIGVLGLKFVHGPSVDMIWGRIPSIENFSMTSHYLLLGYSGGGFLPIFQKISHFILASLFLLSR